MSFTSWSTFVTFIGVDFSDLLVSAVSCATESVLSFEFFTEVSIFRWAWRSPNVLSTSSKVGLTFFFAFLMDFFTANGLLLPFFERLAVEFVVLGFPMSSLQDLGHVLTRLRMRMQPLECAILYLLIWCLECGEWALWSGCYPAVCLSSGCLFFWTICKLSFSSSRTLITCMTILPLYRIKSGFFHRVFDHFPGECVKFEGSKYSHL